MYKNIKSMLQIVSLYQLSKCQITDKKSSDNGSRHCQTSGHLVHVEPQAEVLADAMLLEDGADFPCVDGGDAGVTQQLVRDAL